MTGNWTAQTALALSIFLALLQVRQYFLEAGRVRVRLTAGLLSDDDISEVPKWSRFEAVGPIPRMNPWNREVAILRISNAGRSPVTIDGPSLDLGPSSPWRFWGRRTVGPMLEKAPGATEEGRVRLEPFDDRKFVFDVWQILNPSLGDSQERRPLSMRGSITVSGKLIRRRSPWRRRWQVKNNQFTFRTAGVKVSQIAFASLKRHGRAVENAQVCFAMTAMKIQEAHPLEGPPPTSDEVEVFLSEWADATDKPQRSIISVMTAFDLQNYYNCRKR